MESKALDENDRGKKVISIKNWMSEKMWVWPDPSEIRKQE